MCIYPQSRRGLPGLFVVPGPRPSAVAPCSFSSSSRLWFEKENYVFVSWLLFMIVQHDRCCFQPYKINVMEDWVFSNKFLPYGVHP